MPAAPRHRRAAALAVVVALALAGCAPAARPGPTAAGPPTTAATADAAPTPTPTPTPTTVAPGFVVGDGVGLPTPEPLPVDPRAPEPVELLGTIDVPAIDLRHAVYEGVTLTTIDRGPGHWPGTALPGQTGNAVFGGHRTTHTSPFFRLHELDLGDEVVFTDVDGRRFVYEHTGTEIVAPDELSIATQTPAATATLFACHPPGSAAQRIVAHLRLVGGSGVPSSFPARDR